MTERALPVTILEPAGIDPDLLDHTLSLRFDLGQFDPRITFTRNSSATYFGSDGLLKTAAANEPRIDYDPVTKACKGFLVEESRTNLLTYSEQFDNAAWVKSQATITSNAVIAPDGTLTADKLVESTANSQHDCRFVSSITAGTLYTVSAYVKSAGRGVHFVFPIAASGYGAIFDLSSGTIINSTPGGVASIIPVGDGWYRCSFTDTAATTGSVTLRILLRDSIGNTYTGDGTSGIYIWGAQLEVGAFPTSYIKTEAAAATRAADSAVMTGTNFSSWYSGSDMTVFTDVAPAAFLANAFFWSFGALTRRDISAYINATSVVVSGLGNLHNSLPFKHAASFTVGGSATTVTNGGVISTGSVSASISDRFYIGKSYTSVPGSFGMLNGNIRRLAYYPKRLSDAKLQALTQ